MTEYGEYEVIGRAIYRDHKPGETFKASLDRGAEQRAIQRGNVRLLRRFIPDLEDGSWTLPDPWPPGQPTVPPASTEAPHGASLIGGGR